MWQFFALILLSLLAAAGDATAQTLIPETYSPSRTVIVLSGDTKVFAGDKSIGTVPPGSVLRFTKVDGKALMVPRHGGWVFADDVVPVEKAVGYFSRIISEKPSAEAYLHRGIAHLQLDKLDEAEADFQNALSHGSQEASVHINLGNIHQKRGALPEALTSYTRAIEAAADSPLPYIERSSVLMEMKQYPEAALDLAKAIELDPHSPEAFNNRGVLNRLQSKYTEAVADYTQAITWFAKYASAYANRGYAYRQLGQFAKAQDDFEKALSFDPLSVEIANDAAWFYATCPEKKFRNPQRALQLADMACSATDQQDGQYLDTLAAAYASSGKFDLAVSVGEQAIRQLADDPAAMETHSRLELYRKQQPYIDATIATP